MNYYLFLVRLTYDLRRRFYVLHNVCNKCNKCQTGCISEVKIYVVCLTSQHYSAEDFYYYLNS